MKILLITTHFPPKRGGVESSIVAYLDYFDKQKGFHSTVLTYDNRYAENFNDHWKKSKIIRVKVPAPLLEYMIGMKSVATLDSVFKKTLYALLHWYFLVKEGIIHFREIRQADVILAKGALIESLVGYTLSVLGGKKYSVRWHTDLSGFLADTATRFCLRKADIVIVNGQDIKDKIIRLTGLSETRVFVTKHAIDTETFRPISQAKARAILNLPQTKFIVLFAAALNKTKFCDLMVSSAPKLLQDSDIFLILIGEGPLEVVVRKLAESYTSNILFIDHFVKPETLNLYINASDITISCVDFYYPARIVLESLACGTPVSIFNIVRREEKDSGEAKFKIPLPNVFTVISSPNQFSAFLAENKRKIHSIRNDKRLIETSRHFVLQNYDKEKTVENEITHLAFLCS